MAKILFFQTILDIIYNNCEETKEFIVLKPKTEYLVFAKYHFLCYLILIFLIYI